MLRVYRSVCAIVLVSAGLSACGTGPADQTQLATINSVYVAPVKEPQLKLMVAMLDWWPSDTDVHLNELLIGRGLHLGKETQIALIDALKSDSYQIANDATEADAIVSVDIEAAMYFNEPPIVGGGCTPTALFDVEMKTAKSGITIFKHTYRLQSGGGVGITGHILVPSDPKYDVSDCASLWATPQLGVEAFRSALPQIAHDISAEVAKPSRSP